MRDLSRLQRAFSGGYCCSCGCFETGSGIGIQSLKRLKLIKGTQNVIDAALDADVKIYCFTDKAVNPVNCMAEQICAEKLWIAAMRIVKKCGIGRLVLSVRKRYGSRGIL